MSWGWSRRKRPRLWLRRLKGARGKAQGGNEERGLATSNQRLTTNLPVPATAFVGRVARLAEIEGRLADPACRLLTLVGPGGVGKTRLALQAAWRLVDDDGWQTLFADGVFFVRMASINAVGQMVTAVSNAINFNFYRDVEPKRQLLTYLRDKKMLIILDNFEHLVLEGGGFVADLLATAPAVKVFVTSREALSLQEEWVVALEGMRYPTGETFVQNLDGYSAIQLFLQNARRIRPEFSFDNERDCVLRICQLVEGIPLALELAASWLKVLPCAEIASEIERSFDLLTTTMRNVPERHRSMRVVFEQSWQMLTANEQAVLQRLSIFRGGFDQQAAEQVAGATLMHLVVLVEKSLVKVLGNGRYLIHNLLRQFAAEKLAANIDKQTIIQNKHSDYFITFLQEQEPLLKGKQQKTALEAIRLEIGNVRKAWQYALSQNLVEALERGLTSLYEFYAISSRYQEGANQFQQTMDQLAAHSVPESFTIKLTARLGAFYAALGVYGLARELLHKSLSSARRLRQQSEIAFSLELLGNVIAVQGNSLEAGDLYQESLELSREFGDQIGTANALYNLGWVAVGHGDYPTAKRHFIESLALNRAAENEVRIAHVLDSLGMVDFFLGEYIAAEGHFRESLAVFRALGDQHGIARTISGLGIVAWGVGGDQLTNARKLIEESVNINRAIGHRLEVARRLGYLGAVANSLADFESAQKHHAEALALAQEIGYSFGVPWSFVGLGLAAAGLGEEQTAQMYFYEAIEIAIQAQNMPIVLDAMISMADLRRGSGQFEMAVEMVTAVFHHPASWQIIKDRATRLLNLLETDLDKTTFEQAQERGKKTSIEDFVIELLTEKSSI
jgi:predicted ATPase